jgi:catechol 2,3-dioxygenase-like lactoylglutathione lyase family enzyme
MERVTGIGGVFFKCGDVETTKQWYRENLGVQGEHGYVAFHWRDHADPTQEGITTWSPFPKDTTYFEPSKAPFMINYRVANLAKMLEQLRAAGCAVDEKVEDTEYGKFGWVMDPDGNRIELWEPPVAK